jgi:hypothetical protein
VATTIHYPAPQDVELIDSSGDHYSGHHLFSASCQACGQLVMGTGQSADGSDASWVHSETRHAQSSAPDNPTPKYPTSLAGAEALSQQADNFLQILLGKSSPYSVEEVYTIISFMQARLIEKISRLGGGRV